MIHDLDGVKFVLMGYQYKENGKVYVLAGPDETSITDYFAEHMSTSDAVHAHSLHHLTREEIEAIDIHQNKSFNRCMTVMLSGVRLSHAVEVGHIEAYRAARLVTQKS